MKGRTHNGKRHKKYVKCRIFLGQIDNETFNKL